MKEFFKKFNYSLLLALVASLGVNIVFNLDFIYNSILIVVFVLYSGASNKKYPVSTFILIILLSFCVYISSGTMYHHYLLTYENGTAICASRDKEIKDGCFSEHKKVKDGEKLGKYIKYEYIGKEFYK